jgi:hypothetical protein
MFLIRTMIDFRSFENIPLRGGFIVLRIEPAAGALRDALGREAIARTRIVGRTFEITMTSDLTEEEQSVTLYHEILEAAAVAAPNPPSAVIDFNEGDFERAAHLAHKEFGVASVENLNRMLKSYGFNEH